MEIGTGNRRIIVLVSFRPLKLVFENKKRLGESVLGSESVAKDWAIKTERNKHFTDSLDYLKSDQNMESSISMRSFVLSEAVR